MLALTRQLGQSFTINGNIRVTVMEVDGNNIRFTIDGPPQTRVDCPEGLELLFQTSCPEHPDVTVTPDDFRLLLASEDAPTGVYEFRCPGEGHDKWVRKPASEHHVLLIRSRGIEPVITAV
jgi:carbon storage regulator CsrA